MTLTPFGIVFKRSVELKLIKLPRTFGKFPEPTLRGAGAEYDIRADTLPPTSPTVTRTRPLLPVPPATRQDIDTSDCHSVASLDEEPIRSPTVCHWPKLVPATVKLTEPVEPVLTGDTLAWLIAFRRGPSTDQLDVRLPDAPMPVVTARHLLALTDALATRHMMVLADNHCVPSQPDWPIRTAKLLIVDPNPTPMTVMLLPPRGLQFANVAM